MLLGLTGGIASGKSTFLAMLSMRRDFACFDADRCVHDLLAADPDVARLVRDEFGTGALGFAGSIDRPALRRIVFGDPAKRKALENILHPRVRREWLRLRDECARVGKDFVADIPLLFETAAEEFFDATIVVAASRRSQLSRLAAKGIEAPMAEAMLASQWPLGDKIRMASVVVWNDGSVAALEHQADLLLGSLFPTAR